MSCWQGVQVKCWEGWRIRGGGIPSHAFRVAERRSIAALFSPALIGRRIDGVCGARRLRQVLNVFACRFMGGKMPRRTASKFYREPLIQGASKLNGDEAGAGIEVGTGGGQDSWEGGGMDYSDGSHDESGPKDDVSWLRIVCINGTPHPRCSCPTKLCVDNATRLPTLDVASHNLFASLTPHRTAHAFNYGLFYARCLSPPSPPQGPLHPKHIPHSWTPNLPALLLPSLAHHKCAHGAHMAGHLLKFPCREG